MTEKFFSSTAAASDVYHLSSGFDFQENVNRTMFSRWIGRPRRQTFRTACECSAKVMWRRALLCIHMPFGISVFSHTGKYLINKNMIKIKRQKKRWKQMHCVGRMSNFNHKTLDLLMSRNRFMCVVCMWIIFKLSLIQILFFCCKMQ